MTSESGCPSEVKERLGLVQVYTGDGKGKTTCALGLAFRAVGCGLRVVMIQFLKPAGGYGEQISASRTEGFEIVPMGVDHMDENVPLEMDLELTRRAMDRSRDALTSGEYDLVILDEINNSMRFGHVTPSEVISMLESRAPHTEVVLTGRGAPQEVLDYADLVTEMRMVKHPMDRGVPARRGIEYRRGRTSEGRDGTAKSATTVDLAFT